MDEIRPTRFSRRILLSGAAGAALSAILSACTVTTATETPGRSTPIPGTAAPSPTRAGVSSSIAGNVTSTSGTTASTSVGTASTPGATAIIPTRSAPGIVTIATGVPASTGTTSGTATGTVRAGVPTPTRVGTPTPMSNRATAASDTGATVGAASPGASTPAAIAATDLGPAPDPSNFSLITANATGNPTGVKVPADLNGRLSLKKLTIALPPSDDPQKTLAQNAELLNYLRAAFAIDVVGVAGKDYTSVSDAMAQRAVDVAFLSPAAYALAYRDAGAAPLVQGETPDGKPVVQNTVIVVAANNPIKSLVELKAKNLAVVDGDPLSGHWIGAWLLLDRGKLVEDQDYMTTAYGTHVDAVGAVIDQRVDAAATLKQTLQLAEQIGTLDDTKVKVLETSFDIPGNLMAVRGGIAPEDINLLTLAFLTLNDQPVTSRVLQSFVLGDAPGTGQFGPGTVKLRQVDDTTYAGLRAALDAIKLDLRDSGYKVMQPNAEDPNPYNAPLTTKTPVPVAPVAATAVSTNRPGGTTTGATTIPRASVAPTARAGTPAATPRPANTAVPAATVRPTGGAAPTAQPTARSTPTSTAPPAVVPTATITQRIAPTAPSAGSLALPAIFVTANAATNLSGVSAPTDLGGQLTLNRLVVAFPPTKDPARALIDYGDLLAYLRAAFGIDVIGAATTSGTAIVDAMRNKQVDLALLSNVAYILAHQNANGQALIQGEGPDGAPVATNTVMIARADSAFSSLRDLGNTNIGFVETDPVVGRIVPTAILRDRANLTEGKDYHTTSIGTHADAYQAVLDGVIDVAAVAIDAFALGVEAGSFDGNAVKILDTSFAVPQSILTIRGDIINTDADRIGLAFLTINDQQRSTRLFNSVVQPPPKGKGVFGLMTNKLRRADDSTFNDLRNAVTRINFNLQALLK